jgi:hypothetical protein
MCWVCGTRDRGGVAEVKVLVWIVVWYWWSGWVWVLSRVWNGW